MHAAAPAGMHGATPAGVRVPLVAGALGVVLAALLAPGVPLPLPLDVRWVGAFVLFVLLPGSLLVRILLPSRSLLRLDTVLLMLGAGYGVAILLGLALHTLFRPIAPWQIAAGGGLVVVALALAAARRAAMPSAGCAPPARDEPTRPGGRLGRVRAWLAASWPVLLLLAVAAPLRLFDLGWSEFQGDEARVVLRAMAALQGAEGALAAHRKVPGEILLAYVFAGSLGQIVEQVARLPYALSSVGAVLAFYSLARKLLGGLAGLIAGLLLAVNGYFVAFGRILQYDSLAFFLGIVGLLCCWQFGRGSGRANDDEPPAPASPDEPPSAQLSPAQAVPWAVLGALLLSGAALVALGAIFLVLPALLLAGPGLLQMVRRRSWAVLAAWSWPVLPALLAAVLVFGESGSGEGPRGVWSYLGPRFGGGAPYWNGPDLLVSANHYLSSPYLLVMMLCGMFALVMGLISVLTAEPGRCVLVRLGVAIALAALSWSNPRVALAVAAALAVALVVQAPSRQLAHYLGPPLGMRVALLWAAGPLFAHLFLIRVPGTHFREAFPGLILITVGLAVPALVHPRARLFLTGLFAVLVIGSGDYAWVTLVQRVPEYQITYPANRHMLDWSGREGRGLGGVFGAVHRHGWKALGVLMPTAR
jgi:4-amino-4-deoxy-L-arabinose transferase-like glycosyltransferase